MPLHWAIIMGSEETKNRKGSWLMLWMLRHAAERGKKAHPAARSQGPTLTSLPHTGGRKPALLFPRRQSFSRRAQPSCAVQYEQPSASDGQTLPVLNSHVLRAPKGEMEANHSSFLHCKTVSLSSCSTFPPDMTVTYFGR